MTEALYVALLRGINVGGRAQVAMADLRDLFTALGFRDVRTLLQSGNVVFRADDEPTADLERLLEAEAAKHLDVHPDFLVRTADEWAAIVAGNAFPDEAERNPGHLLVMCLKQAPSASAVEVLQAAITGPEVVRPAGRHLYITYPSGVGTSRLSGNLIESKLRTRGTARNWNTVLKLAALVQK
jgi:uncharacterized protein (DUF1697 family)